MGRKFTDEDFMEFMKLPETQARTSEWELTLIGMEQANMTALWKRVLAWLPAGAVIQARVVPLIKPRTNSFLFGAMSRVSLLFSSIWKNRKKECASLLYEPQAIPKSRQITDLPVRSPSSLSNPAAHSRKSPLDLASGSQ
jgi:hypothetical protein